MCSFVYVFACLLAGSTLGLSRSGFWRWTVPALSHSSARHLRCLTTPAALCCTLLCLLGRSGAPLALPPRPVLRSAGARLLQFFQFNPRPLWSLAASSVLCFVVLGMLSRVKLGAPISRYSALPWLRRCPSPFCAWVLSIRPLWRSPYLQRIHSPMRSFICILPPSHPPTCSFIHALFALVGRAIE